MSKPFAISATRALCSALGFPDELEGSASSASHYNGHKESVKVFLDKYYPSEFIYVILVSILWPLTLSASSTNVSRASMRRREAATSAFPGTPQTLTAWSGVAGMSDRSPRRFDRRPRWSPDRGSHIDARAPMCVMCATIHGSRH